MTLRNHLFFYEDCNATKDSSSLIEFFEEGGWFNTRNDSITLYDYVSYPIHGGVIIEQKIAKESDVTVIQITVLWQKCPSQSFLR